MSMIHDITAGVRRYRRRLRKGRGESSGHGKTSGRGTKGSGARQGKPIKRGHEGGQTPIYRRLPTRGFSNFRFAQQFHVVNIGDLNEFADDSTVDVNVLVEAGLVPDARQPVKILGNGRITRRLTVLADWYSHSAHEKINAAGGAAQNLKGEPFQFPKPKKKFVKREAAGKGEGKKPKEAPAAEGKEPTKVEAAKPDAAKAE